MIECMHIYTYYSFDPRVSAAVNWRSRTERPRRRRVCMQESLLYELARTVLELKNTASVFGSLSSGDFERKDRTATMIEFETWERGDWIKFLVSSLLVLNILIYILSSTRKAIRLPPGRLSWPLWDDTMEYLKACADPRNPDKWIDERRAKYGDVFKARLFNNPTVFLLGAQANRWLFQNEHQYFKQSWPKSMRDMLGHRSVSVLHGEPHRQIRLFFEQILGTEYVKRFMTVMEETTLQFMERWNDKEVIPFYKEHLELEFASSARLILGGVKGLDVKQMERWLREVGQALVCLPIYLPGTTYWKGCSARDAIHKIIYSEINKRRTEYEAGLSPLGNGGRLSSQNLELARDLLDLFLFWEAGKEQSESKKWKFSDQEVAENMTVLIIGAHGTTVSTMTSALQILSSHPDIIEELRKEIRSVAETKAPNEPLTWSDTKKLRYMRNVFLETFRYRTTIYSISKKTLCDVEFDGYTIPKGWVVNTIMRQTHNKEENFPSPEVFDPTRFEQNVDMYSFVPFGRGPRECPGEKYAIVQLQVFLYHFLQRYDYELVNPNEEFNMFFVPVPKQGLEIKLKPLTTPSCS